MSRQTLSKLRADRARLQHYIERVAKAIRTGSDRWSKADLEHFRDRLTEMDDDIAELARRTR